jgi:thiol-disulfide isomerase/thioredoxin
MRYTLAGLLFVCLAIPLAGQEKTEWPSDEKAKKTYEEALNYLRKRDILAALEGFKKADKQDGGHCRGCQQKMIKYGTEAGEWKFAEIAAEEITSNAQGDDVGPAHYLFGMVLMNEALSRHKDDLYNRAHEEMTKALAATPNFPKALYVDGLALAHLKQDDAAKAQFERFIAMRPPEDPERQRAVRYISEPELARARMAPPFAVTTLDGQRISLDDLKGKVVLLDFWATWCGPCREALPHMQKIAKTFQGEPLVVLSVSLDSNEQKWKAFITEHEMTWQHCRDGGFEGPLSRLFSVNAIPHTFTIDADGVLQDERIGDASIEGKLKKLVSRAKELQAKEAQAAEKPPQ